MRGYKLFAIVFWSAFLAFSSCKKDAAVPGPTNFTLQLKAKYGSQNFEINSYNVDPGGRFIQLSTFKFYLSHINLIKADGSTVSVAPVALFDLNDTTNLSITAKNIQGNFTAISFVCGLDSLQDDTTDPNLYQVPNPLSYAYDMTWTMLKYQFESIEGKWDSTQRPIMRFPLVYHIGTPAAYRQTTLTKMFSVSGSPYNMVLNLDIAQIFNNTTTNTPLDIVNMPASQSGAQDNPAVLPLFCNNFSNSFTIQ